MVCIFREEKKLPQLKGLMERFLEGGAFELDLDGYKFQSAIESRQGMDGLDGGKTISKQRKR